MRTRLESPKQCQVRFILDFSAPWQVNSFSYLRNIFYAVTVHFLVMQLQFQNFPNYLIMQLQFFFLPDLIPHKYSVEGYVRLVGQEPAPSKCVLLSTSREVRKDMKDWVLSQDGDQWSVKFDVRDLGGVFDFSCLGSFGHFTTCSNFCSPS